MVQQPECIRQLHSCFYFQTPFHLLPPSQSLFFFHLVHFQQSVSRRRAGKKNGRDDTGRLKKELKRLQFLTVGSACRMEGVILKNFTRTPINQRFHSELSLSLSDEVTSWFFFSPIFFRRSPLGVRYSTVNQVVKSDRYLDFFCPFNVDLLFSFCLLHNPLPLFQILSFFICIIRDKRIIRIAQARIFALREKTKNVTRVASNRLPINYGVHGAWWRVIELLIPPSSQ